MKKNFLIFLTAISIVACTSKDNHKKQIPTTNIDKRWLGEWKRLEWQKDATLEIKKIEHDSIEFFLFANSGGHNGEIEGKAIVTKNRAKFIYAGESDKCVIEFNLYGDTLVKVNQKSGNCFTAMGVTYSGNYRNEKNLKGNENQEDLVSLGILQSEIEDKNFRSLVGDSYMLFVNSTQLTSEDDDLDEFGAKVYSSAVRGLFTFMENIVMIDTSGHIWAAVISDNKVYYFSNDKDYMNKLPKTIDNWRQRFKDYEVVYN